jgi:hypothetical protein
LYRYGWLLSVFSHSAVILSTGELNPFGGHSSMTSANTFSLKRKGKRKRRMILKKYFLIYITIHSKNEIILKW